MANKNPDNMKLCEELTFENGVPYYGLVQTFSHLLFKWGQDASINMQIKKDKVIFRVYLEGLPTGIINEVKK